MAKPTKKELTKIQQKALLSTLQARFDKNKNQHKGLDWEAVNAKLLANPEKLWSLNEMENTGGEPDVVAFNSKTGEYTFFDCAADSPAGRRSLCYDKEALDARKENKPANSAQNMANEMGIEMLNETQYRFLQTLGKFDAKTSSWLNTPNEIRKLGGAIFADFRFGTIFVYHNGVQSYYAGRAFRGALKV
ncbi:MAG: DUF4256 domain-containing protein [bacterium]|nr:DUF4256 domain-containing protein [bacterium]